MDNEIYNMQSSQAPAKKPVTKIIFVVLGLFLVAEIIWAVTSISKLGSQTKPVSNNATSLSTENTELSTISLSSDLPSAEVGQFFNVKITLNSEKMTDGTDVIINYDRDLLEVVPNSSNQKAVTVTDLYQEYPLNSVDASQGMVALSGITSDTAGVLANGLLGTVTFKAKKTGIAKVTVQYITGATSESNIIETGTGKDILTGVEDVEVQIQ